MHPLAFPQLLEWALAEHRQSRSMFGISESLFYAPRSDRRFETQRPFGTPIGTPIGPAAGPHTQLAQNIASAWLCGARYIELKTVQVLDRLEIPRPCIDAADEGYNVEWSQELTLEQSAREYANAWALVHVLPRALGHRLETDGVAFNQSVGYTLEGIRSEPVRRFLDKLADARELLDPVREVLRRRFPALADVEIPNRISDSVTLSTMHGCPPDEIERIARHLLEDRGLHIVVKLNPTLLGKDRVTEILHERLGFRDLDIPGDVFERDLQFAAATDLIASLRSTAERCGRGFAVKLSNTLAMRNPRDTLPGDTVYMSGRALYPITIDLLRTLRAVVGPDLAVTFSAGADAVNAPRLLASGACPVTVATDLLKPGGYGRLHQLFEELERAMDDAHSDSLDAFAAGAPTALEREAALALENPRYHASYSAPDLPKLDDALTAFDCIAAPCVGTCPACQDVPLYAAQLAEGNPDAALAAILHRNPLPAITGHICTAKCETRCTRANLDRPVRIRDLKRFAAAHGNATLSCAPSCDRSVAVLGAGPSGLSAATFLALSGIAVTIFELAERAGGMPAIAPAFRIPRSAVDSDIARIRDLGVEIRVERSAPSPATLLETGFDAVYVAVGFAADAPLEGVPGLKTSGVLGALDLLRAVADGRPPKLGARVLVVGGGNTAVDAARTALRLADSVSILYRRTQAELPADRGEVDDFLSEGGSLVELVSPVAAISEGGHLSGVDCVRNHLGRPGPDGRRRPIPMPETRFRIHANSLILAIGQAPDLAPPAPPALTRAANGGLVVETSTGRTSELRIFAGGDVARGPSTIIEAVADGRRAAAAICSTLAVTLREPPLPPPVDDAIALPRARLARCRRVEPNLPAQRPLAERHGFALVTQTLGAAAAEAEAKRCLGCHLACDKCIDVCPNRANVSYLVAPAETSAPILDLRTGAAIGTELVKLKQQRQIAHIVDLCNECGNCATFCVHSGRPFADKPRLCVSLDSFRVAEAPVLLLERGALAGRDETEWRLESRDDGFAYVDSRLEIDLTAALTVAGIRILKPGRGTFATARVVERAVLWRGLGACSAWTLASSEKGVS